MDQEQFKISYEAQTEAWVSMDAAQLEAECHRFDVPVSDSRQENLQTLFRFMQKVQAKQQIQQQHSASDTRAVHDDKKLKLK